MRKATLTLLALFVAATLVAPAAWAQKNPTSLKGDYKGGFKLTSENGKFSLRLFSAAQFRYTYMDYDDSIAGNTENYSNFYMRRARIWWDGHAYDPNFTYYFHLQLEPQGSVNLHDAWIAYKFSDLFTLGVGRNKIPYGTEFLSSGFGLNFIDRSIMYGETDINSGGGVSKWPGSNAGFPLAAAQANTGFPLGGMSLFRSQGIAATGMVGGNDEATFQYEVGVWQGRDSRASSNSTDNHLFSVRLGYYPLGWFNWLFQGDVGYTESFKIGFIGSAYTDTKYRTKDVAGTAVTPYETDDQGYNLSVLMKYKGLGVDLEWSTETFDLNRDIAGPTSFDREGWRASAGYFVVPTRVEVVARYAQLERLKDPTAAAVTNSGLGFVKVWNGASYANTIESKLTEMTAGVNFYFGAGHQHKLFFDVSLLGREFQEHNGFDPDDQEDKRFRSMLQFKF